MYTIIPGWPSKKDSILMQLVKQQGKSIPWPALAVVRPALQCLCREQSHLYPLNQKNYHITYDIQTILV